MAACEDLSGEPLEFAEDYFSSGESEISEGFEGNFEAASLKLSSLSEEPPAEHSAPRKTNETEKKRNPIYLETFCGYQREMFLKKKLLQGVLTKALDDFFSEPNSIHDKTTILGALYQRLLHFPVFRAAGPEFVEASSGVLSLLPEFSERYELATGRSLKRKIRNLLVGNLMVSLRTEAEVRHFERIGRFSFEESCEIFLENEDSERNFSQRKFIELFSTLLTGLQASTQKDQPSDFFTLPTIVETFLCSHSPSELPCLYSLLFSFQKTMMMHSLEKRSMEEILKSRKMYRATPRRSILAILKLTNPAKVVSKVFGLIFLRPFGGQSAFQKIVESCVNPKYCEKLILMTSRKIPHKCILRKCHQFVEKFYPIDFESIHNREKILEILSNDSIEPRLEPSLIASISDVDCFQIHSLILHETKRRDRLAFIEFLSRDEFTNFFKIFICALQKPLKDFMEAGGLYRFAQGLFSCWTEIIRIDEHILKQNRIELLRDPGIRSRYDFVLAKIQAEIHTFLHHAITLDRGALGGIIGWLMNFWFCLKTPVEISDLMQAHFSGGADDLQRSEFERELDSIIFYYKNLRKAQPHPDMKWIPCLYSKFADRLQQALCGSLCSSPFHLSPPKASDGRDCFPKRAPVEDFTMGHQVVGNLEVVFEGEPTSLLARQGFLRLSQDLNMGNIAISAYLWVKYIPHRPSCARSFTSPITSISVSTSDYQEKELQSRGFIRISRDISKRSLSGSQVYLWYQRGGVDDLPVRRVCVVSESSAVNVDLEKFTKVPASLNRGSLGSKVFLYYSL